MIAPTLLLVIDAATVTLVERSRRKGVRRSRFCLESDLPPDSALRAPLEEVSGRRGRVRVLVALGAPTCRVKSLFGIPEGVAEHTVNAELEADPSAFFLGDARELLLSPAALRDGRWYAAAVERTEFVRMKDLCVAAGLVLSGVVPLAELGDVVASDEVALAALSASPHPLLVDPAAKVRAARRLRRRRLGLLAAMLMAAITAAFGPWGAVAFETRRLERLADALEEASGTGARATGGAAEQLLGHVSPSGRAMSLQLGLVFTALPAGAVLTLLEADTARVRLSVLSPPDSALVEALARRSGLREPRLSGAIVPVVENGVAYDRYTVELAPNFAVRVPRP